ncbi:hypothetical protein LguiA_027778 [Lonicera macranthoides]
MINIICSEFDEGKGVGRRIGFDEIKRELGRKVGSGAWVPSAMVITVLLLGSYKFFGALSITIM